MRVFFMPFFDEEVEYMLQVISKAKEYGLIDLLKESNYRSKVRMVKAEYDELSYLIAKLENQIIEYQKVHRA
jgi:hypothetical protein